MEQVHAGGWNKVFLQVQPRAVWGSDLSGWNGRWTTLQSRLRVSANAAGAQSGGGAPRSQDKLIVLFSVATMAVMVGSLSAKRLRSRKLTRCVLLPGGLVPRLQSRACLRQRLRQHGLQRAEPRLQRVMIRQRRRRAKFEAAPREVRAHWEEEASARQKYVRYEGWISLQWAGKH